MASLKAGMMSPSTYILAFAVLVLFALSHGTAQEQTGTPPTSDQPADSPASPDHPAKAPKPKSRLTLIKQMQADLDTAAPHAKVDGKDRKKLDKCHDVLLDAAAQQQQQRYKSVNVAKVNGCLKDLDTLLDAGAFAGADRDKLLKDSEKLGESVGKTHRIKLPQPL
jgi:hypothetical protein